jgi:hypothetical protein
MLKECFQAKKKLSSHYWVWKKTNANPTKNKRVEVRAKNKGFEEKKKQGLFLFGKTKRSFFLRNKNFFSPYTLPVSFFPIGPVLLQLGWQ